MPGCVGSPREHPFSEKQEREEWGKGGMRVGHEKEEGGACDQDVK